jgi:hypothetical protein
MSDKLRNSIFFENIIGSILFVITGIILYTTYYGSHLKEPTVFIKGVDIFSKFSVLFIAFGIFLSYIYYRQNLLEVRRSNTTKLQEEQYVDTIKYINANWDKSPKFCQSLYYKWQINKNLTASNDPHTNLTIASIIFQNIETVINVQGIDNSSPVEWSSLFIQWLHNKDIQELWNANYHNYSETLTLPFINRFIEVINTHPKPNNSKELQILGKKLSNDPEILRVISLV